MKKNNDKSRLYLEKEFRYMREASKAFCSNKKIKYFIYNTLYRYYERKYEKVKSF